ncbi:MULTISPECIES: hypothetical protein [unclassified Algibacter]|uniref:hypothetical protein n=1 Tax=unclassified Algibacter TaxID=2615009 RepID=UPI00131EAF0B|nr:MULTISPECIES: hypothetical protein [unclassified Algibacter]MCL5128369.1 hypothetical protein [Algibacter sp. L4_22]
MTTKIYTLLLIVSALFLSCKTQQSQTKASLPKIENQFKGELDYAKGGFELVQWQNSGDEIVLGKIDEKGIVHLNLPEYDIKALGKNHMNSHFESQFNMLICKDKGEVDMTGKPLFKTPYDDVYSQLYPPMYVKKYDAFVAYVSIVSDEEMLIKENFDENIGNRYYWIYVDRAFSYKEKCIRGYSYYDDREIERSADIQFKKGWNLVKSSVLELQQYGENNKHTIPKKILFTLSSQTSKDVKWYLERVMEDEKIQGAKKEYELEASKSNTN